MKGTNGHSDQEYQREEVRPLQKAVKQDLKDILEQRNRICEY